MSIGTRAAKRKARKDRYLSGRSRKPYSHTPVLSVRDGESDNGATSSVESSLSLDQRDKICSRCWPVLSRYVDSFESLVHQDSALKKCKHINPSPSSPDVEHHRDTIRQNDWIRSNLFDPLGNYLFCCNCICAAFKISKQRLSRQKKIKQSSSKDPIVDMTKKDVDDQRLSDSVVMPASIELSFLVWWRSLSPEDVVQVQIH